MRPPFRAGLRSWRTIAPVGLFDSTGVLLFSVATTRGLLSVVSVLASLYPVVIVLLVVARIVANLISG